MRGWRFLWEIGNLGTDKQAKLDGAVKFANFSASRSGANGEASERVGESCTGRHACACRLFVTDWLLIRIAIVCHMGEQAASNITGIRVMIIVISYCYYLLLLLRTESPLFSDM